MSRFEKEARVRLPGGNGAQAVIVDVVESVTGFPIYALRWLDAAGETHTGSCGEGDLLAANLMTPQGRAYLAERMANFEKFVADTPEEKQRRLRALKDARNRNRRLLRARLAKKKASTKRKR